MAHPNFLSNSSILIGGSSGMGFAVASGVLPNGSNVHITSVTAEKLSAKIAQLQTLFSGAHVSGSVADLSNTETLEATLQSVLDAAVKETGKALDHIVYTAGDSFRPVALAKLTATTALSRFTVRYIGPLLVGKLVAANPGKYLSPAASSSITLTSGILAHRPRRGVFTVSAAGALEAVTRGLAVELAPIRVNVVIPGVVRTELLDKLTKGNPDIHKDASLTKEVGSAAGAAEAYLFSMRSTLATGQGITIDSGYLLVQVIYTNIEFRFIDGGLLGVDRRSARRPSESRPVLLDIRDVIVLPRGHGHHIARS